MRLIKPSSLNSHGPVDQLVLVHDFLNLIRENTRIVHFQSFSKYDVRKGRNEGLEINFKRVKIIFVLIWRKFLSPVLHWAKRHSKSYCIHVVLILYKTGCLIMTQRHVCNRIINGIYRSSFLSPHSFVLIVYIYAFKSITARGTKVTLRWVSQRVLCERCRIFYVK